MGAGYWIGEFIGLIFFWFFLNIKALFQEKDERRYYSFFELWKGATYLPPGDKPDERPYTTVGCIIWLSIMLIGLLLTSPFMSYFMSLFR